MSDLNFTPDEWKKGMGDATPASTPTPMPEAGASTTTAPSGETAAPTQARSDAADAIPDTRPRNADGTFAPKAGETATAAPAEREPFDGFGKLDPAVQAQFRRLTGERDDYKLRYIRADGARKGKLQPGPTRQSPAGSNNQQSPGPGASPAGQAARDVATGMRPGANRDAVRRQIDAWEKHAADFPDDAKAIEQRLGLLSDQIRDGAFGPITQELRRMQGELSELREMRGEIESIRTERQERQWTETQGVFDSTAGDNWRQIAGFEDEQGRPVTGARQWHPDFVDWVNRKDPDIAERIWDDLSHKSPRVVAARIAEFNREVFGFSPDAGNPSSSQATPASAPRDRRAENLRDIAPGSGGTAKPNSPNAPGGGSSEYSQAIRSAGYREWRERTA